VLTLEGDRVAGVGGVGIEGSAPDNAQGGGKGKISTIQGEDAMGGVEEWKKKTQIHHKGLRETNEGENGKVTATKGLLRERKSGVDNGRRGGGP